MTIRNLDVVSLDADTITCNTLTVDSHIISDDITEISNRLMTVEDKTTNQSRSSTNTEFSGSIQVDTVSPYTQPNLTITPGLTTTGTITTTSQITTAGDLSAASTLYVNGTTNRVGINQSIPSYELDVTGSARVTGTLFIEGNLACSTLLIPSNPVTLSGTNQIFSFPNSYTKKFTIGFLNSEFWASSAVGNNNFVFQLGTASAYIGSGYNGGYTTISSSPNLTNWGAGAAVANTAVSTWSGVYNGQITFTNMGSNVWVWEGGVRAGTNTGILYGGSIDCGANVIDRIRLSCTSTTATYTANNSCNMRGSMNIVYEY